MSAGPPLKGKIWTDLVAQVRAEEDTCWLCHQWIDPQLKYPDPHSFSVDHVIPRSKRPDLAYVRENARAAHLRCNVRRQAVDIVPERTSRRL